jgi:hypothetical protein
MVQPNKLYCPHLSACARGYEHPTNDFFWRQQRPFILVVLNPMMKVLIFQRIVNPMNEESSILWRFILILKLYEWILQRRKRIYYFGLKIQLKLQNWIVMALVRSGDCWILI